MLQSVSSTLRVKLQYRLPDDDIFTTAELILGVSRGYSKLSAEKLLNFLCRMSLTERDIKDHLYSLEVCQKGLEVKISKTVSCMNMDQWILSSLANTEKREQHIFYMRDSLEVTRAQVRLDQNN